MQMSAIVTMSSISENPPRPRTSALRAPRLVRGALRAETSDFGFMQIWLYRNPAAVAMASCHGEPTNAAGGEVMQFQIPK
jgi:hypothetical protein